jgi:hypothetical protein
MFPRVVVDLLPPGSTVESDADAEAEAEAEAEVGIRAELITWKRLWK